MCFGHNFFLLFFLSLFPEMLKTRLVATHQPLYLNKQLLNDKHFYGLKLKQNLKTSKQSDPSKYAPAPQSFTVANHLQIVCHHGPAQCFLNHNDIEPNEMQERDPPLSLSCAFYQFPFGAISKTLNIQLHISALDVSGARGKERSSGKSLNQIQQTNVSIQRSMNHVFMRLIN